jgi:ABC-type Zn uptake system ZnuABC Zn-binding protein ZnuA
MVKKLLTLITAILFLLLLPACGTGSEQQPPAAGTEELVVVATTSIVADVVAQVGGEQISLSTLLPTGADPHSYSPTPQDAARLAGADLIFANGAGLETFLEALLESADAQDRVVSVSDNGIELLEFSGDEHESEDEHETEDEHENGADPHTWVDPNHVKAWVDNIEQALSSADTGNAQVYQSNAARYTAELDVLDAWIREQVAQIPEQERRLVTDHMTLGYFAEEYGFELVGALIPGYSTLSEPTAQELAEIETAIGSLGVKAVFVDRTVNSNLAERVAADTGTQLVYIYSGSLSDPGGEAGTYLDYMRYNVSAIVEALKE